MNGLDTPNEKTLQAAGMPHSLSPRATLNPVTPLRDGGGGDFSPFALFSEERKDHLRAVSPVMSLEELQRMLAEEWERLPEEAKTPYRDRASERSLQQRETMGAAIALTQIGTPSFRPAGPTTPVPRKDKARRCLDIGTPEWQSPKASEKPFFGDDDANSTEGLGSSDRGDRLVDRGTAPAAAAASPLFSPLPSYPATSSTTPSASPSAPPASAGAPGGPTTRSVFSAPPEHGGAGVVRRRGGASPFTSPAVAAAAVAAAAAAAAFTATPGSGEARDEDDGGEPISKVGLEVRAAAGGALAAAATSKNGGSGSVQVTTAANTTSRSRVGPSKATTTSSAGRKHAPSSSASSLASSKRAKSSSPAKTPAAAATAAAVKKTRSKERARKTEYKAGREIVSKMSKKDPARPKGPQSSYILFYTEKVASARAARPDMSITEIGTAVGEAWRGLSDEKRSPYTKRAEVDRRRYEGQLRTIARKAAAAAAAAAAAPAR